MKETWVDIKGYEGFYQVNNLGEIRVLPHIVKRGFCTVMCPLKVLKPRIKDNGYLFVCLSKGSKKTSKEKYVHRLVAEAFIEKSPEKQEVDHIDGVKTNNNVSNLRWVTRLENVHNVNTLNKNNTIKVRITSRSDGNVMIFDSLTKAAKELNVPLSTLSWAKTIQKRKPNTYKYKVEEF